MDSMLEVHHQMSYATATASGPVGSVVASNAYLSISSGHGGLHGSGSFSPRSPLVEFIIHL